MTLHAPTTKRPHGEQTARRLLEAALLVHADGGPEGFTVQAVLDRSGVSLGSLYHHFGSANGLRAALYVDCLGRLLDACYADLRRARTAKGGVRAVVVAYLRFTQEHAAAATFVHASSYATFLGEHGPAIAAQVEPRVQPIREWFAPHVASGRVVPLSDDLIEMLLIGPVAEVSRRWLSGAPGYDLDEAARQLPPRIWASLRGTVD